jgi:hypothetical protein
MDADARKTALRTADDGKGNVGALGDNVYYGG